MHLKLLLKQSWHDFYTKITLYLTFTCFLILAISISLGMISFSYGYVNLFNQTIGSSRVNAFLTQTSFLPVWVEDEPDSNAYFTREKTNESGVGYFYQFLKDFKLTREAGETISDQELELLLLGVGYKKGQVQDLTSKNLLEDSTLKKYFENIDLKIYNQNVLALKRKLNLSYQTNNLLIAYLTKYIIEHPLDYRLFNDRIWGGNLEMLENGNTQPLFWEFLKVDPSMDKLYNEKITPKTLRVNPTNTQKIWKTLNLNQEEYQKYWDNYHFVYVPAAFLHQFHYKVGDSFKLRFKTWDDYEKYPTNFENYLIAGVLSAPNLINIGTYPAITIPYPLMESIWRTWYGINGKSAFWQDANLELLGSDKIFFNVINQNGNLHGGQQAASHLLGTFLSNRQNPTISLQTDTAWTLNNPGYAYEFSQQLFLIIAYVIGLTTLILLFVVFYFITQQIVLLQRQTLFFLKAMGVKNSGLSLLTTLSMLPSLLIGLLFGFFGALAIQEMVYSLSFSGLSFYMPYFSFNWVYFLTLLLIVFLNFFIFYFINTLLMKSRSLTVEGMSSLKTNAKIFEMIKVKMQNIPPKIRLGSAFAFKNIYKNLIAYLIMTITFGLTLFNVQFTASIDSSVHAYERWNSPYKSILYADNLGVFAPTRTTVDPTGDSYLYSYQQVDNLQQLISIGSDEKLIEVAQKYRDSLTTNEKFNWKKGIYLLYNFLYIFPFYYSIFVCVILILINLSNAYSITFIVVLVKNKNRCYERLCVIGS